MKLFNIGFPELLLILIMMLILLGPEEMQENARKFARLIRKIVKSDSWRTFWGIYKDVKNYPHQIMKDAELDEFNRKFNQQADDIHETIQKTINQTDQSIQETIQNESSPNQKTDQTSSRIDNGTISQSEILYHIEKTDSPEASSEKIMGTSSDIPDEKEKNSPSKITEISSEPISSQKNKSRDSSSHE